MRGVSYVPIDAAKHRSSRSRVPGLRAGHSFMWSRPLPVRPNAGCFRHPVIFGELRGAAKQLKFVLSLTDSNKFSCFRRPIAGAFVLLPTRLHAFADRSSCFCRPISSTPPSWFAIPN